MIWNFRGDKWINQYFDLLKIFDAKLNNFSISPEKNLDKKFQVIKYTQPKYFINVLTSHPKSINTFIGGDNKGNIYIFDTNFTKNVRKISVGNYAINCFSFSQNGNYLGIGFETGKVILTDFADDCKLCLNIEEHFNSELDISLKSQLNNFLSYVHLFKNEAISNRAYNNKYYYSVSEKETSIKLITMHNTNSIILQNISIQKNSFLENKIKTINLPFTINYLTMQSSEEYIICLSVFNKVSIIRIDSGEICGEINLNSQSYSMKVDPSGLYLAILASSDEFLEINNDEIMKRSVVSFNKNNYSSQLIDINNESKSNLNLQRRNEGDEKDLIGKLVNPKGYILFYEIGTGKFIGSISSLFQISNFEFSNDGKNITVNSQNGHVSIWELIREMKENIKSILIEMNKNPKFWESFRINYESSNLNTYKNMPNIDSNRVQNSKNILKDEKKDTGNFKPFVMQKDFDLSTPDEGKFLRRNSNQKQTKENIIVTDNKSEQNINLMNMNLNNNLKNDPVKETSVKSVYVDFGEESISEMSRKDLKTDKQASKLAPSISQQQQKFIRDDKSIQTSLIDDRVNNSRSNIKKPPFPENQQSEQKILYDEHLSNSFKRKNSDLEKKQNQDEIRNKNIEQAMRKLEYKPNIENTIENKQISNKSVNVSLDLYNKNENFPAFYDKIEDKNNSFYKKQNNYFINNTKDNKNKTVLEEPEDIDDIVEVNISRDRESQMKNQIEYSNLNMTAKNSYADDIENAYENMQRFENNYRNFK